MKYFLHDSNAFNDEKITELYINFGYEGLGLFYTILEKLAGQEKPVKTLVLKKQLNVGKKLEKCWSFMEEIGIISSSNGDTFNERILSYSETYKIKKEKNREKISQWRDNKEDAKNVTGYEPECNHPKVKESKVKESKESSTAPDLKNSNLFRQPSIPKFEDVVYQFKSCGGNEHQAQKFFDKYNSTGWYLSGSPIVNFKSLIPKFIENWLKNERTNTNTGQRSRIDEVKARMSGN